VLPVSPARPDPGRPGRPDRPDRLGRAAGGRARAPLEPPVLAWLARALPGDPVTATAPLSGGYSNENLLVTTGRGRYVLRRYPRRAAADAARTCAVEAALAPRLAQAGVPVPELIAADPAGSAAGEPLLLARYVPGATVRAAIGPDGTDRAAAAEVAAAAGRALAAIGAVTFARGGAFTGPGLIPSGADLPGSLPEFVETCLRAGSAASALSPGEMDRVRALAAAAGPLARRVASARQLVHSDYNGKNLLVLARGGRWSVSAVLDWEFAFSGSPLTDIGNMLRFREDYPPGFGGAFIAGYQDAGGRLPPDWREISEALDLYALADFLTRPPGHRYFGRAVAAIRRRLAPR
jgi:aminoglycoside phosphotransferase (APT) family kinase protein